MILSLPHRPVSRISWTMEGKELSNRRRGARVSLLWGLVAQRCYLHQLRGYGPEYSDCDVDRIDEIRLGRLRGFRLISAIRRVLCSPNFSTIIFFFFFFFSPPVLRGSWRFPPWSPPEERLQRAIGRPRNPVMFLDCMTIAQGPGRPTECGLDRTGFYTRLVTYSK